MPTKITIDVGAEDAEKLMRAFREGKLAEFGVTELFAAELPAAGKPDTKWRASEEKRRDATQRDDVPPRG